MTKKKAIETLTEIRDDYADSSCCIGSWRDFRIYPVCGLRWHSGHRLRGNRRFGHRMLYFGL